MSSPPATPGVRLIAGLGNPGRDYRETRHNIGFMIADRLVARASTAFRLEKRWHSEIARAGDLLICKPQTFMNLSGQAVREISGFYKLDAAQILIVLDDMALPLGKLRLRPSGSAGGHNGLQSVIEHFGTQAVPRLRVGIGAADGNAISHVLGRFGADEMSTVETSLDLALEAIDRAVNEGIAAAMNACN